MNKFTVILDDEDAAVFHAIVRIFGGFTPVKQENAGENAGEAPAPEVPTRTRRSRADAAPASSTTEPASDAGASAGRRRRRAAEPEAAPAPAAAEEPVRRRRAAPVSEGISDADVSKAASQAAAKITPALVMQILKEDHGVSSANQLPQEERQKFLDTLKAEMAD